MEQRERIIFFVIVGLAAVVIAGLFIAERLGVFTVPTRRVAQVPIRVAVSPALVEWAEANAHDFNARNADANVTITAINGLSAIKQMAQTAPTQRPQAWLPEAIFVAAVAQQQGLPFEPVGDSVASTELTWGAFNSRASLLINQSGALDWAAVQQASVAGKWSALGGDANWGYLKLTIASPTQNSEGLAALLSAAAFYHAQANLTYEQVTNAAFLDWLRPIVMSVPNFNTLGPNPAESMATRGPSVGDVGMLPAAAWQRSLNGLQKWEAFVTLTPSFSVRLDYPYVLRTDLEPAEKAMAQRFSQYLKGQADGLTAYGFSSPTATSTQLVTPSTDATVALLRWAERERIGQ